MLGVLHKSAVLYFETEDVSVRACRLDDPSRLANRAIRLQSGVI